MQTMRAMLLIGLALCVMGLDCFGSDGSDGADGGIDGNWTTGLLTTGGGDAEPDPDDDDAVPDSCCVPQDWICGGDCGNPEHVISVGTRREPPPDDITVTPIIAATMDELTEDLLIELWKDRPDAQITHDILWRMSMKIQEDQWTDLEYPQITGVDPITFWDLMDFMWYFLSFEEPELDRIHAGLQDMWFEIRR